MLALSFLILIGFMLIAEGAHLSHLEIFKKSVGVIPKGYLYFAIAFSLGVEILNMKIRKKKEIIEKNRKYSVILLILFLVLPTSIELVHAFEVHEITLCTSKTENHFHQNDFKCKFCHLQIKTFAIIPNKIFTLVDQGINFKNTKDYQFLLKHQELLFSLRGPPFFNFS